MDLDGAAASKFNDISQAVEINDSLLLSNLLNQLSELECNALINMLDNYDRTLLENSCHKGNTLCTQTLISFGANINYNNRERKREVHPAIIQACLKNSVECLHELLTAHANVNITDKNMKTPLMWASQMGNVQCMKLLIDYGVDVNARDIFGKTAIIYASQFGRANCITLLIDSGAQIYTNAAYRFSALIFAAISGSTECVELLLANNVDINVTDHRLRTPLIYAAISGDTAMAKLLLQHGADKTLVDDMRKTASNYAEDESLRELLRTGNLNYQNYREGSYIGRHGIGNTVSAACPPTTLSLCQSDGFSYTVTRTKSASGVQIITGLTKATSIPGSSQPGREGSDD